MRIDPFGLRRPKAPEDSFVLTDPEQPGVEIAVRLRALNPITEDAALEQGLEWAAQWVEGKDPEKPAEDGDGPRPIPMHGGEPLLVNRRFCINAAYAAAMWQWGDMTPYSLPDFAALSVTMPTAWIELQRRCAALNSKAAEKNPSGAATAPLSESP